MEEYFPVLEQPCPVETAAEVLDGLCGVGRGDRDVGSVERQPQRPFLRPFEIRREGVGRYGRERVNAVVPSSLGIFVGYTSDESTVPAASTTEVVPP